MACLKNKQVILNYRNLLETKQNKKTYKGQA